MEFLTVKTRAIKPPQDDVYKILDQYLPSLKEKDIIFITSKILGIHQGRCIEIPKGTKEEVRKFKDKLIKEEAESFIPRKKCPGEYVVLTLKENTLIPSAGIDESNSDGYFVMWPQKPYKLAKEICNYLKKKKKIKNLAVVITDSHTTPLRFGISGISVGFFGIEPLKDYRGKKDIFGRIMKISQSNIVDSLADFAVLLMGEGKEKTPIVIGRNLNFVKFTNKDKHYDLVIPPQMDIYYPLLKNFKKKYNKK